MCESGGDQPRRCSNWSMVMNLGEPSQRSSSALPGQQLVKVFRQRFIRARLQAGSQSLPANVSTRSGLFMGEAANPPRLRKELYRKTTPDST